ncbi:WD repeat domain phosphoinositide-interacting protein 3 [Histomonas meleagridis]|uniref:WD repeat domain phosphoinositide-interacting protein 3 n=1 Tax=Histomonas meleagridis TaxID=135588 RepID=UPI00355968FC|nr:WD repeat domain phosphoinositide-interacting protein 3 [Histomonas meleagridis]KAH0804703.1 WD repeat domain phosphoinositide-interacting protein 3 [Histomonas meleagridis]
MFAFSSETEVRVYTFKPPMIFCQYRTAPNKYAPCDFIKYKEYYMVAMTGREPGMLRIIQNNPTEYFDITIPAHSHPLSVIKFNSNGSLIATASESGTLIQLFDVKSEQLIAKFRRGKLPAAIMCIAFSYESEFLAVASAKGTVHIFELSSLSAVDQNTATRAEMKIEFPGETIVAMEFMSRNMIYVAFKNGDLKQIKFNEANKTVTIEKNDSLVGMF